MIKRKSQGQARRNKKSVSFDFDLPWRTLSWSFLVLSVTGLLSWGWVAMHDPELLPLRSVQITGEFSYLNMGDVNEAVSTHLKPGFFEVNVDDLQQAVKALPWMANVAVRRIWPDTLLIQATEHVPVAQWGADGVVSDQGVLFYPQGDMPEGLPVLEGPTGQLDLVLQQYQTMRKLIHQFDSTIVHLVLDERRAWTLWMDTGVELKLGRKEAYQQLLRFAQVYPQVFSTRRYGRHVVDMRYSNGFSVRWDDQSLQAANGRQQESL